MRINFIMILVSNVLYGFTLASNDESGNYDGIEQDRVQDHGEIYGDVEEDLEFQNVTQNPYYGIDVEMKNDRTSKTRGGSSQTEIITRTSNVYYEI